MKTIEEKAIRYVQAIKVAKSKIKNDKDHVLYEDDIIEIFPELKESEDERIRTKLLNLLKELLEIGGVAQDTWSMNDCKQFIAWLEKQGEQKAAWSEEDEAIRKATILYLENAKDSCAAACVPHIEKSINWLKSLKDRVLPQPKQEHWKECRKCGQCGYYMAYVTNEGTKNHYGDCASIGMNNECNEGNNHFKDPNEPLLQVDESEDACGFFKAKRTKRVKQYIKTHPDYYYKDTHFKPKPMR